MTCKVALSRTKPVYIYIYTYTYVYIYICIFIHAHTHIYTHIYIYTQYMYVYTYNLYVCFSILYGGLQPSYWPMDVLDTCVCRMWDHGRHPTTRDVLDLNFRASRVCIFIVEKIMSIF